MSDHSSSSSEFVDINTKPLMEAAFEAKKKWEMLFCRHLVCSIQDRSPYPRKYVYSGEVAADLCERSFAALHEVLWDADQYEARRRARKRLDYNPKPSQSKKKDKGKGILKSQPPKRRPLRRRGLVVEELKLLNLRRIGRRRWFAKELNRVHEMSPQLKPQAPPP